MNTTAAHNFTFGPFLQYTWDNVQDPVLGELAGVFFPAKVVAPLMVERKRGNLIAISSTVSRRPTEGTCAHASGKAGVGAFMCVL